MQIIRTTLEIFKFLVGLTFVAFAILGGIIYYLEAFGYVDVVMHGYFSPIWNVGVMNKGNAASSVPIFLGLCGIAGAYLLANTKFKKP